MNDSQPARPFSQETIDSVLEVLGVADEYGIGVAFTPDGDGWRISYLTDWPAYQDAEIGYTEVAVAHDLHVAAQAALRPLMEFGDAYHRYLNRTEPRG